MRSNRKFLIVATLAAGMLGYTGVAAGAAQIDPDPSGNITMQNLKKAGYSCEYSSLGAYLCTKSGEKTYVCDSAGKCAALMTSPSAGGLKPPPVTRALPAKMVMDR